MPATCVPWPSCVHQVNRIQAEDARWPAGSARSRSSGREIRMRLVHARVIHRHQHVLAVQVRDNRWSCPRSCPAKCPPSRAINHSPARARCDGSRICTPGNCASCVQSAGASTRSTGPNAEWSRPMIFAPRFSICCSVASRVRREQSEIQRRAGRQRLPVHRQTEQ